MDDRAMGAAVAAGAVALWLLTREGRELGTAAEAGGQAQAVDVLARTAWGEARSEGAAGMQAVLNVIMNRARIGGWWGDDPVEVATKPWQFSAWNKNDPNRGRLLSVTTADPKFREALALAARAVAGTLPDITGGATHYYADYIAKPTWAAKMTKTATIGRHLFYV